MTMCRHQLDANDMEGMVNARPLGGHLAAWYEVWSTSLAVYGPGGGHEELTMSSKTKGLAQCPTSSWKKNPSEAED